MQINVSELGKRKLKDVIISELNFAAECKGVVSE